VSLVRSHPSVCCLVCAQHRGQAQAGILSTKTGSSCASHVFPCGLSQRVVPSPRDAQERTERRFRLSWINTKTFRDILDFFG
jgi:hypothetical protein